MTKYFREFEKTLLWIFSEISPSTLGSPRQAIWGCLALPSPLGNPRQGITRYLGLGRARRLVVHVGYHPRQGQPKFAPSAATNTSSEGNRGDQASCFHEGTPSTG